MELQKRTFFILFAMMSLFGTQAHAISVKGVLSANTRWTKNMSPVFLTGDLTIAKGATLTIDPGVEIQVPSGTSGTGGKSSSVEFVIKGTVNAIGTKQARIIFQKTYAHRFGRNVWNGMYIDVGGTLNLAHALIQYAWSHGIRNFGTAKLSHVEIYKGSAWAIHAYKASTTVTYAKLHRNRGGISQEDGSLHVSFSEIVRNTSHQGILTRLRYSKATFQALNNTIAYNQRSGIHTVHYRLPPSSSIIRDNIIVQNDSTSGVEIHNSLYPHICENNLLWHGKNGAVVQYKYKGKCLNNLVTRPLFIDPVKNDFRLLDRSPARKKGTKGQDLGAHPWTTHTTKILHGYLYKDLTLPAGAYQIPGDLVVAKGVTLTLKAGAILQFSDTDDMEAKDPDRSALRIDGILKSEGTNSKPVFLRYSKYLSPQSKAWRGLYNSKTGYVSLKYTHILNSIDGFANSGKAKISNGSVKYSLKYGLYNSGELTVQKYHLFQNAEIALLNSGVVWISDSIIEQNAEKGRNYLKASVVLLKAKSFFNRVTIRENKGVGLYQNRGDCSIKYSLVYKNAGIGIYTFVHTTPATFIADHNTVVSNQGDGISAKYTKPGTGSITIKNNIFAKNSGYEINQTADGGICQNNLAWDTSGTIVYIRQGARCINTISKDPLFVDFAKSNYHLRSNSPAKGKATDRTDLGAYAVSAPAIVKLIITPSSVDLVKGQKQQFKSAAYDKNGAVVSSPLVVWKVLKGGGSVDTKGLFTAGTTSGTFTNTIEASIGTLKAYATVRIKSVVTSKVVKVVISPSGGSLKPGQQIRFRAYAKDTRGKTVTGQSFTWSLPNGGGSIRPSSGLRTQATFTAGSKAGRFAIIAKTGNVQASISVTIQSTTTTGKLNRIVIKPGSSSVYTSGKVQFSALGYDSNNKALSNITFMWKTSSSLGRVDSKGLFSAGSKTGTVKVTVSNSSVSATATVTIKAKIVPKLARIVLKPSHTTVHIGKAFQFKATAYDTANKVMSNLRLTWKLVSGRGSINNSGLYTAAALPGSVVISASSASIKATASISIVDPLSGKLARIVVSPSNVVIQTNGKVQFTAKGYDKYNKSVPLPSLRWVTSGGGKVDNSGVFIASSTPGVFTISASTSGIKGSAKITITKKPVLGLPKPRSPKDESIVTSKRPRFEVINAVDPEGKAVTIDIEIDIKTTFNTPKKLSKHKLSQNKSGITTWTPSRDLLENQTYFWRVRASNGKSTTPWIFGGEFFVNAVNDAPLTPTPKLPSNGEVLKQKSVRLAILNARDLDGDKLSYHFQISDKKDFSGRVYEKKPVAEGKNETSWNAMNLLAGKTYYWRARAHDGKLYGAWSKVFHFLIKSEQTASEKVQEAVEEREERKSEEGEIEAFTDEQVSDAGPGKDVEHSERPKTSEKDETQEKVQKEMTNTDSGARKESKASHQNSGSRPGTQNTGCSCQSGQDPTAPVSFFAVFVFLICLWGFVMKRA